MIFTSRVLAFLLAAGISIAAATVLYFFYHPDGTLLVAVLVITFFTAFSAIVLTLESLVFRKLKKIARYMDKLAGRDAEAEQPRPVGNPIDRLAEEIRTFAERKQKEIDDHKKLEAFRREFIADVSHELKTPIFAAQGFVHTLLDGAMNDRKVREKFLKKAAKSLDGLDRLVQDLLTLSQIETGQIRMHIGEVDLYALTRDVLEQFEGKSEKKGVTLRIEAAADKVLVYADEERIAQVLTNLVSNAINHSFEGHEVIVRFETTKKWVVTSVIDSGEGISREHINRIFERFYRVDKSRSRELGGTGLGLAIVKHILEGHRSRPEVSSAPGKGSTFRFKLRRVKGKTSTNANDHKPAEETPVES